jgi:hypothetical protein
MCSLMSLCTTLGLEGRAQSRRLYRSEQFDDAYAFVAVPTPKGPRPAVCLVVEMLDSWLAGLRSSRYSDLVRVRIVRLQAAQRFKHNIAESDPVKLFEMFCAFIVGQDTR